MGQSSSTTQGQTSAAAADVQPPSSSPTSRNPSQSHTNPPAGDIYTDHAGYRRDRKRYGPVFFSYRQLLDATNNFALENLLGEGGFGSVFKGVLTTGQTVAIKRLDPNAICQGEQEFLAEVLVLSIVWHKHIIKMIGYCCEFADNRLQHLIVYEFMAFGSLEYRLYDAPRVVDPLQWNTRMEIASGVAKALSFLHHESVPLVIYRDLKPSNVLLSQGLKPVLSDFGLSRFRVHSSTDGLHEVVMGTDGYYAPEVHSTGQLRAQSDVYSFGVLLLELITGMRALDEERGAAARLLVDWESIRVTDGGKENIADPGLRGQVSGETICKAVALAEACVADDPYVRPDMTQVVHMMGNLLTKASESSASPLSLDQLWRGCRSGGEIRDSVPDASSSQDKTGEERKDPDAASIKDKGEGIEEEEGKEEDEALEIRRRARTRITATRDEVGGGGGEDDDGRLRTRRTWASGDWVELEVDATTTSTSLQQQQRPKSY